MKSKLIALSSILLAFVLSMASCKKKNNTQATTNELEGLQLVSTFVDSNYTIDLYSPSGTLHTGYNEVYFQVKKLDGTLLENVNANWTPVMHMSSMSHSCPNSNIILKDNARNTYGGFMVFQMASNSSDYWELTINLIVDGWAHPISSRINVVQSGNRNVETFTGSDNQRYVLAMKSPQNPVIGSNEMKAVLYRMESMMSFAQVDNYTIKIDPRMTSMGNHTSPNNTNLSQKNGKDYIGMLNLTMTGYWKINLQLLDDAQQIIKGESISDTTLSSSIYFDVAF